MHVIEMHVSKLYNYKIVTLIFLDQIKMRYYKRHLYGPLNCQMDTHCDNELSFIKYLKNSKR